MKQIGLSLLLLMAWGCDSNSETVSQGREAVKEVVTQPFNTLNSAKDSSRQSADQQKTAREQSDQEIQ